MDQLHITGLLGLQEASSHLASAWHWVALGWGALPGTSPTGLGVAFGFSVFVVAFFAPVDGDEPFAVGWFIKLFIEFLPCLRNQFCAAKAHAKNPRWKVGIRPGNPNKRGIKKEG